MKVIRLVVLIGHLKMNNANKAINSDPKKRRSFLAMLFGAGYGWRYAQNKVRYEFDIEIMKSVKLL